MGTVAVTTVTGRVGSDELGVVLPHEHLYFDFRAGTQPDPAHPEMLDATVGPELAWYLRERPYGCRDHLVVDDDELLAEEVSGFRDIGGRTVVDLTLPTIGRNPEGLRELSRRSGVQIIMGSGNYMEEFHPASDLDLSVDAMASALISEHTDGIDPAAPRPGVIGEIGVSPDFTDWERRSLRAACVAQREVGVPLFIHIPSWERLGVEVLRVVLDEQGVAPGAVVLCHMDASGTDRDYQRRLAERGVWLEFDMIGMPFWLTGEGRCPNPDLTVESLAALTASGHGHQLLLSHDTFLKTMFRRYGGNGLLFVTTLFAERLVERGIEPAAVAAMSTSNPRRLFEEAGA
ncbi:phosphotriesterase family protein [Mycolicibacterium palauense]|uniref:phosphotriesterase family protein n=1 Tax=Mycolicibacterium palauense TaxID=2034511 RepID=UPI000BFEDD26|nr:phosphotriesterase [Mycolicibacterium palauense]